MLTLPEIQEMVQKGDYSRALEAINTLSSEEQTKVSPSVDRIGQ